ncbi:hypothetical protein Tco_0824775 [Tanacetum coccineum]|uniref:Uncharacterized protein n=1 Tax=Tanacetum coccineum TaxID=301880 RepID=A0ABQ5ALR6_9ASTR
MTLIHNLSELLGIQDHSNEQLSSKLVPKVVPLAVKTATSRQELELLFHHHIAKLRTTAVNKSPTHYPCDSARTFRVILFSIHNDDEILHASSNSSATFPVMRPSKHANLLTSVLEDPTFELEDPVKEIL